MVDAVIWTEGKTDTQYLSRASDVLGFPYNIDFAVSVDMGDDQLFRQCIALSKASQSQPTIFIFDCDNQDIVSKVSDSEKPYKSWGNNVFSFAIPVPSHRSGDSGACIELYFNDRDLRITNAEGRRLFLSSEFNHASGRHLSDTTLSAGHKGKLSPGKAKVKILDTEVYDADHKNVALSKADFATLIANADGFFGAVDFQEFSKIFSIVEQILQTRSVDLLFGGMDIPPHDPTDFVGRKQQIATIMDEVIQIPNENGLLHGPGGVGKTALLIELSRKLFEEGLPANAPFKNIIWVSAKRDYYDPTLDMIEEGSQQFKTLDQVFLAIMEFHGFEEPEQYSREEQKWLVLELFEEQKTLLILDNFETISQSAQEEIVRFFGTELKRHLIHKPDNSKVMLTSREVVPSGFHQVQLKGLDKRDSSSLMQLLYHPYAQSGQAQLSEPQRNQLSSGNDPEVLRLLMMYNIALEPPNFDDARVFAKELEKYPLNDEGILMDMAEFYTAWATMLKLKIELDPIKEMLRHQKYKELSDHAISLLQEREVKGSHRRSFLLAQCMFNKWEYGAAKTNIDKAIEALPSNSYLVNSYERLRTEIIKKARQYQWRS